jgi:hypothetical protein
MKFKSRLTYRNFIDYFSNKLEKKEKHAFERKMMQDDFDSEAFDGLSKISSQEFEQDFAELKNQIHARTHERKRRIPIWFPYAASIAILIGLGSVLIYLNQYSVQNELIGGQMESGAKKIETPLVKPELPAKESELLDIIDTLEEDSELEILDSEDSAVQEFAVYEEEEDDEEIETFSKSEILSEPSIMAKKVTVKRITKNSDTDLENTLDVEKALSGKVAGVAVSKQKKYEEPVAVFMDSAKKDINRMISGVVLDEDKVPIPGVQIISKETGEGVVTNIDGQFQIRAKQGGKKYQLTASFIGYEQKEVNAQADSTLLVILEPDNTSMDEVVVVAYGSSTSKMERGNTTWEKAKPNQFASISKFEEHLIEELNNANLEHLLGALKVKFSFDVETTGKLSDIKFKGNPDAALVDEIERLLLKSGDWHPAESGGKAVSSKVRIVLKINFK